MRQYTTMKVEKAVEEVKVSKIICNQCGKEIESIFPEPVVFSANHRWGYGSSHDGETHRFDLCEECYDRWIQGFKIPIEIIE